MNEKLNAFKELSSLFKKNNFSLYLVGGTVRDYLLNKELDDMDAVTDATPNEVKEFLPDADFTFARMGSMRIKSGGVKFDVTTLRKEESYVDSRHPLKVTFVRDLKEDYIRRDFTINAMYMDDELHIYDYVDGQKDLSNKIIRMVGNPDIRLKEDPLRILRAIRFAIDFNFVIDDELKDSIKRNKDLINKLNIEKIKMDMKKLKINNDDYKKELFNEFDIKYLLDMID